MIRYYVDSFVELVAPTTVTARRGGRTGEVVERISFHDEESFREFAVENVINVPGPVKS